MSYPHKLGYRQFFLVLWCDTYFDTEELILAPCVVIADHLHFFVDSLWISAAKIVEGKPIAELALSENIVQSRALSPYIFLSFLVIFKTLYISSFTRKWGA